VSFTKGLKAVQIIRDKKERFVVHCSQQDRPSKNAPRILSQLSQESTKCISIAELRNAGVAIAIS
jgi:hypothetical protein